MYAEPNAEPPRTRPFMKQDFVNGEKVKKGTVSPEKAHMLTKKSSVGCANTRSPAVRSSSCKDNGDVHSANAKEIDDYDECLKKGLDVS